MKRIITCSDGTWNKPTRDQIEPDTKDTNVLKLFRSIAPRDASGIEQVKLYDLGVGTGYTWRDKLVGGATGEGLDKHIMDLYLFLVLNYNKGDELFLFGFSRGAYTARSLAGFIRNCGILKPEFLHLLPEAFALYRNRNSYSTPDSDLMRSFRAAYCVEDITPIHFLGVWDTVGSLGIPLPFWKLRNRLKYRFHDTELSSKVRFAFQALAINEYRYLFLPSVWTQKKRTQAEPGQTVEQRWFVGAHSNVGGGYDPCSMSDITLDWMRAKAKGANLAFLDPLPECTKPDCLGPKNNSYTPLYWFWRPRWRKIDPQNGFCQTIDDSVRERYRKKRWYRPRNLRGLIQN